MDELNNNGQPTETPVETPIETGTPTEPTEKVEFDVEGLNKFLDIPEDKRFKSADDFRSAYTDMTSRYDQYKDLENVRKQLKETETEYSSKLSEVEEFYKYANPENIFGSEQAYQNYLRKQQILADNPIMDSGIIDYVLNRNIDTMDSLDLAMYNKMLNIPNLDTDEAMDLVLSDLGVDPDSFKDDNDEPIKIETKADLLKVLNPRANGKLKEMAANARKQFMSIKNTEVPEDKNYYANFQSKMQAEKQAKEEKINSLKESWKPVYDSLNDVTSVQLKDKDAEGNENVIFDFPIDKGVLSKINNIAEEYVLNNMIEPNDENIARVRSELIDGYARNNWEKMVRAAITQASQKETQKNIDERENRQPVNTQTNTQMQTPDISKGNIERLRAAGVI